MSIEEQVESFNIDSIPQEFFELAAKAATMALTMSGITGIYNDPDVIKDQMKRIQDFENFNGRKKQIYYCKSGNVSLD